jgi:hypothetical protein
MMKYAHAALPRPGRDEAEERKKHNNAIGEVKRGRGIL